MLDKRVSPARCSRTT